MRCKICCGDILNSDEITFLGDGVLIYNENKYTILCNVMDFTNIVHRICYRDNDGNFKVRRD